ncbi:MAG: hypothetical protein J4224_01350 [Candidatus Diapherotrites archaeon]|uniref:DUF1795 domain-containing protein n=1 Tax=Candidatus Iainarchaeum sp. TaxID=3101447 RepID=A0A7J4ITQ0_9ARCH|nr:MAG: Serine/threonine protein kinase [archaeon GW2011_AR10]MBS3059050.1 hypothetical protein [Candidatus Diapherotrites archaeon]HIH08881.1 DUF1795 domain-containing protein [Candidatus Diapherotrites archaeon]
MKLKQTMLIFSIISIVILSGCLNLFPSNTNNSPQEQSSVQVEEFLQYDSLDYGMRMKYPKTWLMKEIEGSVVVFNAPENGSSAFNENVVVTATDFSSQPMTLDEFTEISKSSLAEHLEGMQIKGEGVTTLGGLDAYWINYTGKAGDLDLRATQVWTIDSDNWGYMVTYAADAQDFDKHSSTVAKMIESVEFYVPEGYNPEQQDNGVEQQGTVQEQYNGATQANNEIEEVPPAQPENIVPPDFGEPSIENLVGAWRVYSEVLYYDSGGMNYLETPTTLRLFLEPDLTWGYESSSGTWRIEQIQDSDWQNWGVTEYGPKYKIVLNGWNGSSADGPLDQSANGVDFVWIIYRAEPPVTSAPGQIQMKFGHST